MAEVAGAGAALNVLGYLDLPGYQPFHVVKADLLARLGRDDEARAAYARALELTANAVERVHLTRRRSALG